jgi:hypothetical protein
MLSPVKAAAVGVADMAGVAAGAVDMAEEAGAVDTGEEAGVEVLAGEAGVEEAVTSAAGLSAVVADFAPVQRSAAAEPNLA